MSCGGIDGIHCCLNSWTCISQLYGIQFFARSANICRLMYWSSRYSIRYFISESQTISISFVFTGELLSIGSRSCSESSYESSSRFSEVQKAHLKLVTKREEGAGG
jgi:hypothetical protein